MAQRYELFLKNPNIWRFLWCRILKKVKVKFVIEEIWGFVDKVEKGVWWSRLLEHSRVRNLCARGFKTLTEPIFNDEAYLVPVLLCSKLLKTKIN
jgi:hypothetical protein